MLFRSRRELSANLDAAAAALRARVAEAEPAADPTTAEEETPAAARAPAPPVPSVVAAPPGGYPWLRGGLVRLAHEDPALATRILLALVPAQHVLLPAPVEYDLTIAGRGTYAVSVAHDRAVARATGAPRPRSQAAFHVAADVVTLAEVLAGVDKRMGRWIGSVRVHGRRRDAVALRDALVRAQIDLAAAARAGARLGPELIFPAFAYAIDPTWTRGHSFTVTQEIVGPPRARWHISVRDGAPVVVSRREPAAPADAVVAMSREAFDRVLAGEPAPSGERPAIRGDRAAVAALKAWTDRAQRRAA